MAPSTTGRAAVLVIFTLLAVSLVAAADSVVARPSDAPGPSLQVSRDGLCGDGITCLGSDWGVCCSAHGFCGSSDAYCGAGCLPAYGECGEGLDESPPGKGSCAVPITGVTQTTVVTSTVWEAATETRLPSGCAGSMREVTRVVPSTSVVLVTSTRITNRIQTLTASLTINVTVTLTTTNTVRETTTSTRLFRTTSLVVETSTNYINKTNIVVSTFVATLGTCAAPSSPPASLPPAGGDTSVLRPGQASTIRTTRGVGAATTGTRTSAGVVTLTTTSTVTAGAPATSDVLPGTNAACKRFYVTVDDDSCQKITRGQRVSQNQLLSWNPSLTATTGRRLPGPFGRGGLGGAQEICEWEDIAALRASRCKIDCSDIWPGYRLCIGV